MQIPFLLLGCALSVAILPATNPAQAKRVSPSANAIPQIDDRDGNGQDDTREEDTQDKCRADKRSGRSRRRMRPTRTPLPRMRLNLLRPAMRKSTKRLKAKVMGK